MLQLNDHLKACFPGDDPFEEILNHNGEMFSLGPGRRNVRITLDGKRYFLKSHFGIGWKEVLKSLLSFNRPIIGAKTERDAIEKLHALGIPTMTIAGFGLRGSDPSRQRSFLITHALEETITLEDYASAWHRKPPSKALKKAVIAAAAQTARALHENGINHRDFYLCHLRLDLSHGDPPPLDKIRLYVMDLHRAQIREKTPERWIVKDLGSLLFSSMFMKLTTADMLHFIACYRGRPLREVLKEEGPFWEKVMKRAEDLFRDYHRMEPRFPLLMARVFAKK